MSDRVKEYKGSFNQAFRAAEKAGDKQFRWYNPKSKQMEIFAVKHKDPNAKSVNTFKISNQQKQAKKNKQLLTKKKTDSEGDYYDAGNLGELTVTAARTKLKGNEQGFIPITSRTDLVNFEGKPRLYQNYTTGEYFIVDNYGNVIGKSTDSNVEKIGFNQFRKADGSLTDLKERGSVELTAQANRNEANQLTKQDKDRKTDDRERQLAGIRRMQGMANTVQGWMNLPNHAITGGLKLMRDDYTLDDYKQGFTIDGIWRGDQEIGAGDLFEIQNPYGRFAANLVNPMTILGASVNSSMPKEKLTTVKGKPLVVKSQVQGKLQGNFRRGNKPNEGMGTNRRGQTQYGGHHIAGQSNGPVQTSKMDSYLLNVQRTQGEFNPNITGFAFRYNPETQIKTTSKLNPRQYEYIPGVPNPWIEKGYTNPWNSDKPYIPRKINNGRVDVTNSYGFNTPYYSGETIGSGGFNSRQWPQLKTF